MQYKVGDSPGVPLDYCGILRPLRRQVKAAAIASSPPATLMRLRVVGGVAVESDRG